VLLAAATDRAGLRRTRRGRRSYHALRRVASSVPTTYGLHLNLSLGRLGGDRQVCLAIFFFVVGLELKREFRSPAICATRRGPRCRSPAASGAWWRRR